MEHEIVAVRYGSSRSSKSAAYYRFHVYEEPDGPADMDYFFYILRGPSGTVVVDTGFSPAQAAARKRQWVVEPKDAFARLGVRPADVSQLLVTHLHWDHVGNLDAFPDARLLIPRAELDFWFHPIARHDQLQALLDPDAQALIAEARSDGRVVALEDEHEVAPGITALTVGGHSPGQLVLSVDTARGPVVLASDAIHFYEELRLARPFAVVHDLREMYEAYELLERRERDGALVVPGHDPEVTARFPAVDGDVGAFAFRIA